MAKFDFRILLETVEGRKTSYMSQSFVDTSTELVLSSSQVYDRITGSVSCSYQNTTEFSQSVDLSKTVVGGNIGDIDTNFVFKDNSLLSASLNGGSESGSIEFHSSDTDYDRLLRYKFIGEKVCHVLGLPSSQWIYVDQLRLPADDEANYIEGNLNAKSIHVSDKITFANTSNMNSDITFLIDTGSDRHIKFVDTSNLFQNALMMGYDVDANRYEMSASLDKTFHIKNVDKIDSSAGAGCQIDYGIGSIQGNVAKIGDTNVSSRTLFQSGDMYLSTGNFISVHDGTTGEIGTINNKVSITLLDSDLAINSNKAPITFRAGDADEVMVMSQSKVGINVDTSDPITHELTVIGDISASGNIYANEYHTRVVSSSIIHSEGSTIFGDSSDDTHTFQGNITASGNYSGSSTSTIQVGGTIHAGSHITSSGNIIAQSEDARIRVEATAGNHPGYEWLEAGTRKWLVFNDPANDHLTWKNASNTELMELDQDGELYVSSKIFHLDDTDTFINFTTDDINIQAGGVNMMDFTQNDASQDEITFNEAGADLDVRIEGDTDANLFFTNAGTDKVGVGTNAPRTKLHVDGDITATHITASGNISGSITSNLTMGGNIIGKTYKSEKIFSFISNATDGTKYYFPIGAHYLQTSAGPASAVPLSAYVQTAMCDLSIKRLKIQFAFGTLTVGTNFKMYCRKYDGSGDIDNDSNFTDVGTAWTVTTSNIADNDRFFHAPSDWDISAGDVWAIQFQLNGNDGVVWFNGGLAIEENWNTLISS